MTIMMSNFEKVIQDFYNTNIRGILQYANVLLNKSQKLELSYYVLTMMAKDANLDVTEIIDFLQKRHKRGNGLFKNYNKQNNN